MGAYVNPPNQSKKSWLKKNGEQYLFVREIEAEYSPISPEDDKLPVCLVDNGPFKAAGICFSQSELEAFSQSDDPRPKTWYVVDKEDLLKVSEELEMYLERAEA